jgi:diadenosine tetraphosphate (Ap4A) HIT family hydrolase
VSTSASASGGQSSPAEDGRGPEACVTCRSNRGEVASPGGVIHDDGLWRVEHAFEPVPLAGWLVVKPLRHVESVAELTDAEALALGPLVQRTSAALTAALGCPKVYVVCFAESATAPHVHFHLIPRAADLPRERRGPRVFEYMREAMSEGRNLVGVDEAEGVAAAVRERLGGGGAGGPPRAASGR